MKQVNQNIKRKQAQEYEKTQASYCLFTFVARFYTFTCMLLSLLCLSLSGFSQPGGEMGIVGGTSYYLGEYNTKHFKNNQVYIGGLYRYNLNDRFAVRLNAGFSKINGSLDTIALSGGKNAPIKLSSNIMDFSGVVEFNFRSFMVRKVEKSSWWTPYIFAGVGYSMVSKGESSIAIPVGLGLKCNLFRRFSWGVEFSTRKMLSDGLDGLDDRWETEETNFIYNKDWLFVAGITLTYRFPMEPVCYFR